MCLMSVSCKTYDPTIVTSATSTANATIRTHDTVVLRDSVVLRERTIHDTVYITKEIFRDALNSKFLIQNSAHSDTVIVTEWRERVVEKPPERYIPQFYKISTAILYILIALIIVFIVIKIRLRCV